MRTKRVLIFVILWISLFTVIACSVMSPTLVVQPSPQPEEKGIDEPQDESGQTQQEPLPTAAVAAEMDMMAESPAQPLNAPNAEPYVDNFYENYGVNPMIDTEDDNLSTFALDVDTGSYTVTRRYIHDGNLPDKDSVRVEEFVNYFNQDYELPEEGQAFSINIDGGAAPFTENENYQIMRIGIQGYKVLTEERKDISLVFVIDVSGSMDMENRLGLVKEALILLVEQLRSTDRVSIVVYGTEARVVLEPVAGSRKEEIINAIQSLVPEGSTNAADGIKVAYDMALSAFNPEGINRVILCSDGVANVGVTDAGGIWDSVKAHASEGITLTTVGFGMGNYNDTLMEQLADQGDGFYAYVDDIKEAERLFITNLASTLQAIAMDAKVQVDFNPEVVERYRLIGFENRAIEDDEFRDDTVDAGEIGAGLSVTALYEIKLNPDAGGTLATVYLRWEDPESHEVTEINKGFKDSELQNQFTETSPRFQWDVIVAEFAEILRQSYWAQNSTLAGVLEEATRIGKLLPEDADIQECITMIEEAVSLLS